MQKPAVCPSKTQRVSRTTVGWQKLCTWEHTCKDGTKGNKPARVAIEDPGSNVQHQSASGTQQPQDRVPADHTSLPQDTLTSQQSCHIGHHLLHA